MNKLLLIGLLIFAFVVVMWLYEKYHKYQIHKQVRNAWGQLPHPSRTFDDEKSLRKAWELYERYHPHDSRIDELTWQDLDVFSVFQQLNGTYSSIGSEALYRRLRSYNFSQTEQERLETLILYLNEHQNVREQLQMYFAFLGKKDHNSVEEYLNETTNKKIAHFALYVFLGLLPLIAGTASLLFSTASLYLVTLGSVVFNAIYYQIKKQQLEMELSCMSYFVQAISTAKKLVQLKTPYQTELQAALSKIGSVTILGFSFRVKTNSEAEIIFDYLSMILMLPFIAYQLVLSKLLNHHQAADQLWRLMGELEVAAAVLNFDWQCQKLVSRFLQNP